MLGGPLLRLDIPWDRLTFPLGSGWGGKNTGWLATWECPLRTDSASWKSLESFIQLISFCNSCILPVSSRIVSRSSINFLLAIVSNVDPWNRFNSSTSLRLYLMSFTKIPVLLQYLFMKKLLISSMKFFCWNTIKFFLLRLDRFTQFMNSSVMICLEFVFLNLRLTVFEDLLPLSVQKSPNLCVFRVLSLDLFQQRVARSIGHGRRWLTNRQAFSLGVTDLFSVYIEEHLTDCGIVVIHVLEEPLLWNRCSVMDSWLNSAHNLGWRRTRQ